jgi:hypothetical protein
VELRSKKDQIIAGLCPAIFSLRSLPAHTHDKYLFSIGGASVASDIFTISFKEIDIFIQPNSLKENRQQLFNQLSPK